MPLSLTKKHWTKSGLFSFLIAEIQQSSLQLCVFCDTGVPACTLYFEHIFNISKKKYFSDLNDTSKEKKALLTLHIDLCKVYASTLLKC